MIRVNLLPTTAEMEAAPPQIYAGVAVVLLGAVALGGWYWNLSSKKSELQGTITTLEQEAQRLQAIMAQINQFETRKTALQDRINAIQLLQQNQRGPVELMNAVISAIPDNPPGLWLSNLVQRENNLNIEGRAFEVPFIADFIAALNDHPLFQSVELQFWEQDQSNSIRFQLTCVVQPPNRTDEGQTND